MDKQAVLDVLNNLEVIETNGGEDPYILVERTDATIQKLNDVGVSTETIDQYGDEETFCILALGFGEQCANFVKNGALKNVENATELTFPNGYTVQLFEFEGKVRLTLLDSAGVLMSESIVTPEEARTIKSIL